jgi:hypothetical protein
VVVVNRHPHHLLVTERCCRCRPAEIFEQIFFVCFDIKFLDVPSRFFDIQNPLKDRRKRVLKILLCRVSTLRTPTTHVHHACEGGAPAVEAFEAISVLGVKERFVNGSVRREGVWKGSDERSWSMRATACPAAPLSSADADIHASCTCNCSARHSMHAQWAVEKFLMLPRGVQRRLAARGIPPCNAPENCLKILSRH